MDYSPTNTPTSKRKLVNRFNDLFDDQEFENLTITKDNSEICKFFDLYEILDVIGSGSFGIVVSALDKSTSNIYALKIIEKRSCYLEHLKLEIQILETLKHKNIVRLIRVHESENLTIIVMENLKGGSLAQLIKQKVSQNKTFSETEIRIIFFQIFDVLSYINKYGYIHRDLKPENILFSSKNKLEPLKIVDFGLGSKISYAFEALPLEKCGTIIYMAPEQLISQMSTKLTDVWACGIILYILITLKHPFYIQNDSLSDIMYKIKEPFHFPKNFPELAKDLFLRTCSTDLKTRYSAEEAIMHPFITGIKEGKIPLTLSEELLREEITELSKKVFNIILLISYSIKLQRNKFKITKKKKNLRIFLNEKGSIESNSESNSSIVSPIDARENPSPVQILNSKTLKRKLLAEKYQRCNTLAINPLIIAPTKYNTPSSHKAGSFFGNRVSKNNCEKNKILVNTSSHSKIQKSLSEFTPSKTAMQGFKDMSIQKVNYAISKGLTGTAFINIKKDKSKRSTFYNNHINEIEKNNNSNVKKSYDKLPLINPAAKHLLRAQSKK